MRRESIRPRAFATCSGFLGTLVLASVASVASVASAAPPPWDAKFYDPKPLPDDVVLPMPCGGSMAFRKVEVAATGPLGDAPFNLGGSDAGRGFVEGVRPAHIAGSFPAGDALRYYLVAKHEVSRLQYQAVMSDACPTPALPLRVPQGEGGS